MTTGAGSGRVVTGMCVSLDGCIAASRRYPASRPSAASAQVVDALTDRIGAVVAGRRTYDLVDRWDDHGPLPGGWRQCDLVVPIRHRT